MSDSNHTLTDEDLEKTLGSLGEDEIAALIASGVATGA